MVNLKLLRSACLLVLALAGAARADNVAPGAPGARAATWTYADKTGIGTAFGPTSQVWFSLARGLVTETMFGMIHQTQLKDVQLLLQGRDYLESEPADVTSQTSYLDVDAKARPLSPAYRLVNRSKSGHFEVEKHIFTDPDANSLLIRTVIRAKDGPVTPYLLVHPALDGWIGGDRGDAGGDMLHAEKDGLHLVVKFSQPAETLSVGFVGVSDVLSQLRRKHRLTGYASSGKGGQIELAAKLAAVNGENVVDVVIGFGHSRAEAEQAASATLARGYDRVLAAFEGSDGGSGWHGYLAGLSALPALAAEAGDGGKLAYASALVLKTQEDKQHPGALIASLSTPWGETRPANKPGTGYRAVWPRDFYQCAMALLALGDHETPLAALNYLRTVQVTAATPGNKGASGWFLQKTHVDGTIEWVGVQLDQTAMPLMLAWQLSQAGLLSDSALAEIYPAMLKPAANFLADGGEVRLQWNRAKVTPPFTQQERWEEQSGLSPSTTAAVIAGLVAAGDLADKNGDNEAARHYRATAEQISAGIERGMATHFAADPSRGAAPAHYLRIAPKGQPDAHDLLAPRNGKGALAEEDFLDGGFLELVRYGVRPANDPLIVASLTQLDDQSLPDEFRVRYDFAFPGQTLKTPGWRRYGVDGYGEDAASGANYGAAPDDQDRLSAKIDEVMSPTQRGRVWPIFTGERGHYQLALAGQAPGGASPAQIEEIRQVYVHGMELFANQGLMLPEQVWDGVGANPAGRFALGAGTGSATPLSWAHAEYVKLLRSLHDRQVWDMYLPVAKRFARATEQQTSPSR